VGRERVAHEEIGVGLALVAEHLDAVVHPAGAVPAALNDADGAGRELEYRDRLVLGPGALVMHLRGHLRVDARDLRLAEAPPAEGDAMAPQVHHRAADRLLDIP